MNKNSFYSESEQEDSFEQSKGYAEAALDLLVGHRVSPSPTHFTVAYEYTAGHSDEIHRILEAHLQSGKPLDASLLRELYERHLSPDRARIISGMGSELQDILQSLVNLLLTADSGAIECQQTLESSLGHLQQPCSQSKLEAITQDLLATAIKATEHNRALMRNLEAAKTEVTHLRQQLDLHRQEALIDPLTGLFNRRAFEESLEGLLGRAVPGNLSLLVLDIDHFKQINDNHGHTIGDIVLRHVANTLTKCIRSNDRAFRYGGEEFVILLHDASQDDAFLAAENIRNRIAALRLVRRQDNFSLTPFTVSVGIASRRPDDTMESLFNRADQALYLSKSAGRNRTSREC